MALDFPAGWFGAGDTNDLTTYVATSADELSDLSDVQLDGSYAWLPDPGRDLEWSISKSPGCPAFDPRSIDRLREEAAASGITLPAPLIAFLSSERRHWIRSATGCWLELPTRLVEVPGTDAVAIRFLNDQQGVLFWYVAISPDGEERAVLASNDLFDSPERWLEGEDTRTVICAPRIEAFLLRFWIENEIWFRSKEHDPLTQVQREYLERRRRGR